jgi:hypothetical protein
LAFGHFVPGSPILLGCGRRHDPAKGSTVHETVTHSARVGWDYTRNPSSQIATEVRDNDAYAWTGRQNGSLAYVANCLNQYSAVGSNPYCYDANGNLTDDGVNVYKYDIENRLVEMHLRSLATEVCPSYTIGYTGTLLAALHYDPLGRLTRR